MNFFSLSNIVMVNVNFSKLFLWLMPFAFVFLTDDCCGQLIDFEEIAEISKDSLKTIWKNSKIPRFVSPVKNGVKIYHVNYYTKWVNGEKIKASGRYYVP